MPLIVQLLVFAQIVEHLQQTATFHQLHGEIHPPFGIDANLVNGHDVGVFELPRHLRFFKKTRTLH